MANHVKTNSVRLLERAKIKFELVTYAVDENNLAAKHVAEETGEDVKRVFKTLVLHGDRNGYFVCVIPGDGEVDLKKAARAAGDKKAEMIPMKDLLGVTGYIRGGCSPIGMKKTFPTFFDSSATNHDYIFVSGGVRGLQIKIDPQTLVDFVGASLTDLTKDDEQQ